MKPVLLLLLLGIQSACVSAETANKYLFEYDGGQISHLGDEIDDYNDNDGRYYFANWNPANTPGNPKLTRPGMQIAFWGHPSSCSKDVKNGPVETRDFMFFDRSLNLTGVPRDNGAKDMQWAPSNAAEGCAQGAGKSAGNSFVVINQKPGVGGVGMFTFAGQQFHGNPSFFLARDETGQVGGGENKYNVGTFTAMKFDWKDPNALTPWGKVGSGSQPVMNLKTVQSVASLTVSGQQKERSEAAQAKQELSMGFINPACMESKERKGGCQLKVLVNVAVERSGVTDWNEEKWFSDGKVLIDNAQGGLPVVFGPIPAKGEYAYTKYDQTRLPLWRSNGNPTQFSEFADKEFDLSIGFDQFKNILRYARAKQLNRELSATTDADVADQFGDNWRDPASWRMFMFAFGQEVHNKDSRKPAYIGGALKYLKISADSEAGGVEPKAKSTDKKGESSSTKIIKDIVDAILK
jgi:hypothetical protein